MDLDTCTCSCYKDLKFYFQPNCGCKYYTEPGHLTQFSKSAFLVNKFLFVLFCFVCLVLFLQWFHSKTNR